MDLKTLCLIISFTLSPRGDLDVYNIDSENYLCRVFLVVQFGVLFCFGLVCFGFFKLLIRF